VYISRLKWMGNRESYHQSFGNPYRTHQTLWDLFADVPERKRDFLYRQEQSERHPMQFYTLSERPPIAHNEHWQLESKRFQPVLKKGDYLTFCLQANPVRRTKMSDGKSRRLDIVDHYNLKKSKEIQGSASREDIMYQASTDWFQQQGAKHGFDIDGTLKVEQYAKHTFQYKSGQMTLTMIDYTGLLQVTEPNVFTQSLFRGFGHARSFGCGLMLIKRAR
jgi:CRISPR system Cascade subunit CasE